MTLLRAVLISVALVLALASARAQPAPQGLPPGFTPQQFDALTEAISRSVVQRLKDENLVGPQRQAVGTATLPSRIVDEEAIVAEVAAFFDNALLALAALPTFFGIYAAAPVAFDRGTHGGMGLGLFVVVVVVSVAFTVWTARLIDKALGQLRQRVLREANPERGAASLLPLGGLALLDGVGLAATWLVATGLSGMWFSAPDNQGHLGSALLTAVFSWRLYMFAFRAVIRPEAPAARLAAMPDEAAARVYARISTVVVFILGARILVRVAIALNAPGLAIAAGQIVGNLGLLGVFVWAVLGSRDAVRSWMLDVAGGSRLGGTLARHWVGIAIAFFATLIVTNVFGAVLARATIPAAMIFTLNTAIGVILLRTIVAAVVRRVSRQGTRPMTMFDVVARCFNVAVLIGAAVTVAQTWIVDVLALVDATGWRALTRSSMTAGVTLFLAYVGLELVGYLTRRHQAPQGGVGMPPPDEEREAAASRLATMMPLLRVALSIVIVIMATLIVLTEWGVNITPLVAGASVIGLAISFGSQTLVRDIVSGIFYLADDAFRVGEYIDCGKAKGMVQGFTLRSIKLRHQNGQVHTIPFGQLGQITNFSRDWATVKFNLRFMRNTDLEKLRRTAKRIGQEMLEDPELQGEFLEPLKMQGVADVADTAMIVRFKFTVRPVKPTYVQRQAVKRMVAAFAAEGIEFANAMVSVQTMAGPAGSAPAGEGAAAQTMLNRVQAEAAAGRA